MDDESGTTEIDVPDADEGVARAATLLGKPEAIYQASPARIRTKLALGSVLLLAGVLANVGWFGFGPATFGHLHFLIMPPIIGGGLLWHLWRHRGERVLVYESGLLRLQRDEVDSFPWDDIRAVRMRITPVGEPQFNRDDNGTLTEAWLVTSAPTFQVWNVWIDVARTDGVSTRLTAVLADFPELVATIQRRTFPALWALTQEALALGVPVEFGDNFTATADGIQQKKTFIRWDQMKYLSLAGKLLTIKRRGAWLAGIACDASTLNNLHVLFALAAENGVMEQVQEGNEDE